jgi:trk system potassium uptake protein
MIPVSMTSKSLRELDILAKYYINGITIFNNQNLIISPSPDRVIQNGDKLVVISWWEM